MKSLRKLTVLFLTAIMLFTTASPAIALAADNLATYNTESPVFYDFDKAAVQPLPFEFEDVMTPVSLDWQNFVAGEAPAQLSQVSYTLADDVIKINSAEHAAAQNAFQSIFSGSMLNDGVTNADMGISPNMIIAEGAYIPTDMLRQIIGGEIKNGSVVVDEATGTAFKIAGETAFTSGMFAAKEDLSEMARSLSDTYRIVQPQVHEVLKDFNLGGATGETVEMTLGNITAFAENVEDCATLPNSQRVSKISNTSAPSVVSLASAVPLATGGFDYIDMWIGFEFDETPLDGYTADGTGVTLNVNGGVGIEKPELVARYSAFGGYEFSLTFAQECYLNITLQAAINEEIYIPLFGLNIPFVIGSVKGGVFLVVGINGDFRLEIMTGEYTKTKMGARGSTFLCVPTSVHPIFDHTTKTKGDVNLSGKLSAQVKIGPEMKISILGLNLIGAGAFLGAGVSVEMLDNGAKLDVRLYGILEVFITVIGKRKNLISFHPTILSKKQENMEGYKIEIDDCFISPGRVGGRFMKETIVDGKMGYKPPDGVVNYRICIEKGGNPNNVEYHPKNGTWVQTQANVGEFFIGDGLGNKWNYNYGPFGNNANGTSNGIKGLSANDKVFVEFVLPGKTITNANIRRSDLVSPRLPFTDVTITAADSFNDFAVGAVNQQQLKNWQTDWRLPIEDRCELVYPPKDTIVFITPKLHYDHETYVNGTVSIGGCTASYSYTAGAATDEFGRFDTRTPCSYASIGLTGGNYYIDGKGREIVNSGWHITAHTPTHIDSGYTRPDAYISSTPPFENYNFDAWFDINIRYEGTNSTVEYYYLPEMPPLYYNREIYPVEGTFTKTTEDNKVVDRMDYDEYIWVVNPAGTRVITNEEFFYGISSIYSRVDYNYYADRQNDAKWKDLSRNDFKLVRTTNSDGSTTTLFSQRVTAEWVWQAHPNPVKITQMPMTEYDRTVRTTGGTMQIQATGLFPAYYLEGAPEGVTINKNTGLITVAPGIVPGNYPVTVVAVQEYRGTMVTYTEYNQSGGHLEYTVPDYIYYGHDPVPPDKRDFTLMIKSVPPEIQPKEQTSHGYNFTVDKGDILEIPIYTVAGDSPIEWSLEDQDRFTPLPDFASIDPTTGILRIAPDGGTWVGNYLFRIVARNGGGRDIANCSVTVTDNNNLLPEKPGVPTINFSDPNYSIVQGMSFSADYYLTGDEPIDVKMSAHAADRSEVSGFILNKEAKTVSAPNNLPVGTYIVFATASNAAGVYTAQFDLEVTAAATAPVISFSNTRYTTQQDTATQMQYTLTGTEPITVSVTATNERGTSVSGFTVNTSAKTVNAPGSLAAGTYTVTATAKNSTGDSSATFTLEVTASRTAPVIAEASHEYVFEVTTGGQGLNVPISATGSTPITWSLEASDKMPLPIFVEIDAKTGALTTTARILRGTYYFFIKATNDVGSDTRYCELYVADPRVAPKITTTMYTNRMTQGTDYSMQFSATGSAPLTWSLEPVSSRQPVPAEASIDSTGKLSIKGSIAAGNYSFIVKVANEEGSDSFELTITMQGGFGPIIPKGTPEITLLSASTVPSITFLSSVSAQTQASNNLSGGIEAIGDSDIAGSWLPTSNAGTARGLLARTEDHAAVIQWQDLLIDAIIDSSIIDKLRQIRPIPLNKTTIRWSDTKDVYTRDRDTVNGTEYIFWNSAVKIDITKSEYKETCEGTGWDMYWYNGLAIINNFPEVKTGTVMNDVYWYGDLYHAVGRNDVFGKTVGDTSPSNPDIYWSLDMLNAIKYSIIGNDSFNISSTGGWNGIGVGDFYNAMNEAGGNPIRDPWTGPEGYRIGVIKWQSLEFGGHLDEMASLKSGSYKVGLDDDTGCYVPFDYFSTLADNKAIDLSFEQEGFNLTFAGKDLVGKESWLPLYDFGYSPSSYFEQQMLEAVGTPDGEHFVYSFSHHGDLPGTATFDIETGISEGAKVNVYRYDASTGDFTLIANNLTVGANGIVSYRNNTMSHYLITTDTIEGALYLTADGTVSWWPYIIIVAAVVFIAAGVFVFIVLRKKKRKGAPQSV